MPEAIPIYMSTKPHEIVPERYVLHYTTTHCTNCGSVSHSSNFYALTYIRRVSGFTRIKNLIPCDRPIYNLPVERIRLAGRSTPFCCECQSVSLAHLPPPPQPAQVRTLSEPVVHYSKPAAKPAAKAAKPTSPRKPTIEDLA